jgi:rhodanese-related sulfurtransferase
MKEIKAAQLLEKLQQNAHLTLLDVREPIEYHTYNIGGTNVPLSALPARLAELDLDSEEEIVVICKAGIRSRTAQVILAQNGYENVYNLTGGLTALQKLKNHNS